MNLYALYEMVTFSVTPSYPKPPNFANFVSPFIS